MVSFAKISVLSTAVLLQVTAACTRCDCIKEKTYALSLSEEDTPEAAAAKRKSLLATTSALWAKTSPLFCSQIIIDFQAT
jgi:hypothetical protein